MKPEAKVVRKEERATYDARQEFYKVLQLLMVTASRSRLEGTPEERYISVDELVTLVSPFMTDEEMRIAEARQEKVLALLTKPTMGRDAVSIGAYHRNVSEANFLMTKTHREMYRILKNKNMLVPTSTDGDMLTDAEFLRKSDM